MASQSERYSGNVVELRPSLKSVIRLMLEAIPFLGDVYHQYYVYPRRATSCRGVFQTLAEAQLAVSSGQTANYDLCNESRSIERDIDRIYQIEYEDYPALFWIKGLVRAGIRVIDLGGSTGGTFYGFAGALSLPADATWLVVELPAAVELGRRVATARREPRLSFTEQLDRQDRADVFLTMGTLQYMSDPLPDILSGLGELPRHVIVHKVPVTDGAPFWTIQNLSITEVPYYIQNRSTLIASVESLGYTLVDSCSTLRSIRIPFAPDRDVHQYAGFFFERAGTT